MSDTQNQRHSNRDGGNRRPRRNNSNNRNRSNNNGNRNRTPRPPKPLKLTFFQKILKAVGLFNEEKARKKQQAASRQSKSGTRETRSNTRGSQTSTPQRPPQKVPVETPRLYVGNLSYDASEYDIEDLFKGVGTVKKVEIIYNRNTHKSKGYGFVQMLNIDEAERAVEVLHDQPFMGRQLVVNGSKSRKDSDPTKDNDDSYEEEITENAE